MPTHYDTLGVPPHASASDIRKAYRSLALRHHPDKNPGAREEAERRFVAISAAYETLSDESARAAYDRGGMDLVRRQSGAKSSPFDFHRAASMFNENFGEALARDWQPGTRVSGTLVRGGKRVTITIHPDGTTDETEEEGARGSYSYVSRSGPGGGTQIHIEGSIGRALADAVVPQSMQRIPLVGPALTTAVSWTPAIVCMGCCYVCCCRSTAPRPHYKWG